MLLNKKSLIDELLYNRNKSNNEEQLLENVKRILNENETARQQIKNALLCESSTKTNNFNFDLLETDKLFHVSQIKTVSIAYRLRFLDSHLFKNGIPEEAISIITSLEKIHQTKLNGFKIVAPSKAFGLKNYDDPLLFAPIGNDYYYLIHQWGNDLSWYRKLMVLPIKNIVNFIFFCVIISAIGTWLTPETNLSKSVGEFAPIIIFLFLFKSIVVTIAYYFFMMGKNFNSEIWNREFKEN
jgi:hypothetical protein